MKTKILLTFFLIIFCISYVNAAITFPLPIDGKVINGQGTYTITVTNTRTGITMETKTNKNNEFLIDWSNSDNKKDTIAQYMNNDEFIIKIKECQNKECEIKKIYKGQSEIYTEIDATKTKDKNGLYVVLGILGSVGATLGTTYIIKKKKQKKQTKKGGK